MGIKEMVRSLRPRRQPPNEFGGYLMGNWLERGAPFPERGNCSCAAGGPNAGQPVQNDSPPDLVPAQVRAPYTIAVRRDKIVAGGIF